MADISKVQVGETQYDIKDETARGKVAGHVIKNASGTAVTQRANMQFKTAAVTDENGETVVRNVVQMTRAEYDLITPVDGVIYEITDETVTPAVVETVPIAQGGTGATTAAGARENLGLGYDLTDTLEAGQTSISFTDSHIVNGVRIDAYTDTYGFVPTNMTQSGTTVTLTFPAQTAAHTVGISIRG